MSRSKPETKPTILVIIGITGNLSHKMLLPAIERLGAADRLPEKFKLVGSSRRDVTPKDVTAKLNGGHKFIDNNLEMIQMDLDDPAAYKSLKQKLDAIEETFGEKAQRLFYLSVPPQSNEHIMKHLGKAGFSKYKDARLLLEKPFGSDLKSARELAKHVDRCFKKDQVYRIDHYLAKDMAMNLLDFRLENPLIGRGWNNKFIDRIDIVAAEAIDIEGRAAFYEQVGALGDFVQSHLLHLAALVLMRAPKSGLRKDVPKMRLKALEHLHTPRDLTGNVHRAQYKGYAKQVKNPKTKKETFVSLTLYSDDSHWKGVPITLTTGKVLGHKHTEIRLHYRPEEKDKSNELILRVQPNEGIRLGIWSKQPTHEHELKEIKLEFHYNQRKDSPVPHEQVFLSAIEGDKTMFTSEDEVIESWRILKPVQDLWAKSSKDLVLYEPGHWPKFD